MPVKAFFDAFEQNTLSNPKRFKFESHEFFLRSSEQMTHLFPDLPDVLTNTVRLAEQCEGDPLGYLAQLPNYDIPPEYTSQKDYLRALCSVSRASRSASEFGSDEIDLPLLGRLLMERAMPCEIKNQQVLLASFAT